MVEGNVTQNALAFWHEMFFLLLPNKGYTIPNYTIGKHRLIFYLITVSNRYESIKESLAYLRTRHRSAIFSVSSLIANIKLEPLIQTGKNGDKIANYCAISVYQRDFLKKVHVQDILTS